MPWSWISWKLLKDGESKMGNELQKTTQNIHTHVHTRTHTHTHTQTQMFNNSADNDKNIKKIWTLQRLAVIACKWKIAHEKLV